jgi:hypothetical protein
MRRLLYAAGAVLIAWGGYGLFTNTQHPQPVPWLQFFIGANLLTDVVIVPAVIVVGLAVARLGSARLRPYVSSALVLSGVVLLVALPLLLGKGLRSDNPSIQPLDYPRGLLVTLAAVWAGVALVAVIRERMMAPGSPPRRSP